MQRPHVFFNFASTVDGKLSTANRKWIGYGSPGDRHRMDELRARADAILVGAGTLRSEDPDLSVRSPELRRRREAEGRPEQPRVVVVSRSLDIPASSRTLCAATPPVILTTTRARATALPSLAEGAEIIACGDEELDLQAGLAGLAGMGIAQLLVEGGGEMNGSLLVAGLVDEIFVTVTPFLAGGRKAPTPMDGPGLSPAQVMRLRLMEASPVGDEIFCRYLVGESPSR